MKYTIKHVEKFKEHYMCCKSNPEVISTHVDEITSENIEDFLSVLKDFLDIFEENRIMDSEDVKKMFGTKNISDEKISHICDYYNFRFRIHNKIIDEISLQMITPDSNSYSKKYQIPYEMNHFEIVESLDNEDKCEQIESYYEFKIEE